MPKVGRVGLKRSQMKHSWVYQVLIASQFAVGGLACLAMDHTTSVHKLGTEDDIKSTPRAEPSIEQLAIETTGSFTASQSVYDRLVQDIAAARLILKRRETTLRPSLAEISYRGQDDGKTLIFGAEDDETFKQMAAGEYEAWKELNAWYGVEEVQKIYKFLAVRFKGIYNMKKLAEVYSQLPGVKYAEVDGVGGDGSTIKVKMDGETWLYTFDEGWGDCPSIEKSST